MPLASWWHGLTSFPVNPQLKIEGAFDLPQIDTGFDEHLSIEFEADGSCLTSSFLSSDGSTTDCYSHRRPSLASSVQSASPEAFWTPSVSSTSPTTPILVEPAAHPCRQYVKSTAYLTSSHAMFHHLQEEQSTHQGSALWDSPDGCSLPLLGASQDMTAGDTAHPFPYLDMRGFHYGNCNPPLTTSIFVTPGACTLAPSDENILCWKPATAQLPAETIEPGVAFRATIPSSPCYKVEPSSPCYKVEPGTPLKTHIMSSILSSSPLSLTSPRIVPSQYEMDDISYDSLQQALSEEKKPRRRTDRLHRRPYERKRAVGPSSKSKALSHNTGMEYPLVHPPYEHVCSYPDCEKKFKRQEHKKRHERSVHEKEEHHICWVPNCGKDFTRTDNLKSHLRNTHSKRPGVRGNRYVATLDKSSEYYDPEWVGKLDKNGYPVAS